MISKFKVITQETIKREHYWSAESKHQLEAYLHNQIKNGYLHESAKIISVERVQ